MEVVKIIRDSRYIKKTKLLSENKIEIFAPKKLVFKSAEYTQYDTGAVIVLPDNVSRYYWTLYSNFKNLNAGENRLHFRFLSQTFTLDFTLTKNDTFGFVQLFSSSKLKFEHATKS